MRYVNRRMAAALAAIILVGFSGGSAWADNPRLPQILSHLEAAQVLGQLGFTVGPSQPAARSLYTQLLRVGNDGSVLVEVRGVNGAGAAAAVGGRVARLVRSGTLAWVPMDRLDDLANQPGVSYIAPMFSPVPMDVQTGEGVAATNAAQLHTQGYRGAGSTVVIWDLGFKGAGNLMGTELPDASKVTRLYFNSSISEVEGSNAIEHGTAVAEICHEMAPDADMILCYSQSVTEDEAVDGILGAPGAAKVVNASFGQLNGPYDGQGSRSDAFARLRANNVLLCASSGNSGQLHHYRRFTDDGNGNHRFQGTDATLDFMFRGAVVVFLDWDNYPTGRLYPSTDVDLALELLNDQGSVVATANDPQNGSQEPQEILVHQDVAGAGKTYSLRIKLNSRGAGNVTPNVNLYFHPSYTASFDIADLGAITARFASIVPAAVPGVVSVGASDVETDAIQNFSCQGPTVDRRQYPLITSYDNVTSVAYGGRWNGTSASSPHVAGGFTLFRGAAPDLDLDTLEQIMLQQNTQPGVGQSSRPNDAFGWGLMKLDADTLPGGLRVVLQPQTVNRGVGGTPISEGAPLTVRYSRNSLTVTRTVEEDADVSARTILIDPGTTVSFATLIPGTTQRWIHPSHDDSNQNQQWVVSAAINTDTTLPPIGYYHQLRRSFNVSVQSGANPVDAQHPVSLSYFRAGVSTDVPVNSTAQQLYADTGSTYTFGVEAAGGTSEERWASADTTGDGLSDPRTGTIAQQEPEVTASFYHLVRPKVILNGTNQNSTVATSKRKLLGQSQLVTSLSGSFQDWCDNGSPLAFTDQSTGSPLLAASGAREFIVKKGLVETIDYVVQPQLNTSSVRVRRYGSTPAVPVTSTVAPANGRTAAQIYVTVRDSAGSPITGIDPKRIGLFASVPGTPASTDPAAVEGLKITNPTTVTDQNGLVTFQATRSLPGTVTFHATLDGLAIGQPAVGTTPAQISQASVEFLQVMTVPLPQRGLYLLSFPITPDTPTNPGISHQLISDFEVSPTPPQVARLLPGSSSFEFFRADKPSETFRIAPGRGFFLRTTTAGSLELTGQRSQGPTYNLPLLGTGYHMLGNPQESRALNWNMADFEVYAQGTSVGLLSNPATWQYVNPFVWAYSGHGYELVLDPNIPGGQGLRNQIGVFEGFLWLALKNGVGVVYTPNSNRAQRAESITPANFGVSLFAATDDARASVIVGAQRQALRSAPAPAVDDGAPVAMELITADQTRAAADWLGRPVTQPTTWRVAVRTREAGREVTLSWPYLNRQLPAGSRVRLTDLTTGRRVLLNTSSQLRYLSEAGERQFDLTVLPPAAGGLRVTGFRAVPSRGRAVTFEAQLTADAELLLRVSSLTGRVVAEVGPVAGDGLTTLAWDGLDRDGRPVPRGTYQVTLVARSADGELVRAVRTLILR